MSDEINVNEEGVTDEDALAASPADPTAGADAPIGSSEDSADASSGTEAAEPVAAASSEEEAEEAPAAVAETDEVEDEAPAAEAEEPVAAEAPAPATPAKAKTSTPVRKRDQKRDPNAPKPVVRAQAKYVRSSARKARLVCDNFRGKSVEEARAILAVTPRAVARDWSKLLESAVANAEHNHELVGEDLVVKSVQADEGPTIKRFRPRAQGRATRIRKRTSHLTILLTPKD